VDAEVKQSCLEWTHRCPYGRLAPPCRVCIDAHFGFSSQNHNDLHASNILGNYFNSFAIGGSSLLR